MCYSVHFFIFINCLLVGRLVYTGLSGVTFTGIVFTSMRFCLKSYRPKGPGSRLDLFEARVPVDTFLDTLDTG